MTTIKLCGMTNVDDARAAARLGVEAIGLVFADSPRRVTIEDAQKITAQMPGELEVIGVFVDAEPAWVREVAEACHLDGLQFHGEESPEYCAQFAGSRRLIKALRVTGAESFEGVPDYPVDWFLVERTGEGPRGGTGVPWEWEIAAAASRLGKPVLLAGGLTVGNVAEAIRRAKPFGVDVSTGVERQPGRKDLAKMTRFVDAVRRCDAGPA